MLRGAINPAPEMDKSFDSGGQGLTYDVLLACGSTIILFATSKGNVCTAQMRSCVSCALGEQHRTSYPGRPASTIKGCFEWRTMYGRVSYASVNICSLSIRQQGLDINRDLSSSGDACSKSRFVHKILVRKQQSISRL